MPNELKFIKQDDFSAKIEEKIKNEEKRRNLLKNFEVFHSSQLTQCSRRILYRIAASSFKDDIFEEDTQRQIKRKWLKFLEDGNIAKLLDIHIEPADAQYRIVGNVDAILEIEEKLVVFMAKGLSPDDFDNLKSSNPPRSDTVEIMVNMWLTEVESGILLYDNKLTNEFSIYHVSPYQPIIDAVCKKCDDLADLKIAGILPKQPYKDPNNKECSICEFNKTCWKSQQ
tara:strand:- start:33842 stop:34522 length:681 start_codon:yes stop_codon:yes gene_type:complete